MDLMRLIILIVSDKKGIAVLKCFKIYQEMPKKIEIHIGHTEDLLYFLRGSCRLITAVFRVPELKTKLEEQN